jgi:cytosine deaminase
MSSLLIRGVRFPDGETGDLAVADGRIVDERTPGTEEFDGAGYVAVPRMTDAHLHLDKTLLGATWYPHRAGRTVAERIARELDLLTSGAVEDTFTRACRLVELALRNGSTRIRSHVDISARLGLSRLQALLAVRERYQDAVAITLVAFPQEGILASPGTAELLEEAVASGVEAVGGLDPATRDGDIDGQLDVVFGIAARYGRQVDIHLHDPGELGTATMREISARTRALDMLGQVCISHGYALAEAGKGELTRTATALAEAGVSLITNVPGEGRLPPVGALLDLGVNVVFASDNVRDAWSPYGKADMLERVAMAGYQIGWNEDGQLRAGLDRVTVAPSRALGDPSVLLRPGDPADFTLVRAGCLQEAIVMQPAERIVFKGGAIVARDGRILTAHRA